MTLLWVHIVACLLSYILFCAASVTAFVYLRREKRIKRKQIQLTATPPVSLKTLDTVLLVTLLCGFVSLSIGLPTGLSVLVAKYGQQGAYSMRLVLPSVVWCIYLTLLGLRYGVGLRGRKLARSAVYGFGCAVLSSFYEWHAVVA